jgi:hypothetical protein
MVTASENGRFSFRQGIRNPDIFCSKFGGSMLEIRLVKNTVPEILHELDGVLLPVMSSLPEQPLQIGL